MRRSLHALPGRRQSGFVLVTALIFFGLTLMIVLAASRAGAVAHTIVANQRARSLADAGAEAALRRAERWLFDYYANANGRALTGDSGVGAEVYNAQGIAQAPVADFLVPDRWTTTGARRVTTQEADFSAGADATARLAQQPAFVIEYLGKVRPAGAGTVGEGGSTGGAGYEGSGGMSPGGNSDLSVYRITGKSVGPNATTVQTLQSVFAGRTKG